MRWRISFLLVSAFWIAMNVLLWRSEFGGPTEAGAAVPIDSVWRKIITAPDNSSLEIYRQEKKIGFARWAPNAGDKFATGKVSSDEPEGRVRELTGYTLEIQGSLLLAEFTNRIRFDLSLKFGTNGTWQEIEARAANRHDHWTVHASAAEKNVRLQAGGDDGDWERTFTFEELSHPQKLLEEFVDPLTLTLLSGFGLPGRGANAPAWSLGLKWDSQYDWIKFGHSKVRVYRLHTRLLDRFDAFVYVSRVGEILWVHLPGEIAARNEEFAHF